MSWRQVTCEEREAVVSENDLHVVESLTDLAGRFGVPHIVTVWATETRVLRDERWPDSSRPCEHWIFEEETE